MNDIDIKVSGDNAVVDLSYDDLFDAKNLIHIKNDPLNPADRLYLNLPTLPSLQDILHWKANIDFAGRAILDLFVLLKNKTIVSHGEFAEQIKHVFFTDQKIKEKNTDQVILQDDKSWNVRLILNNFKTKEGYVFCSGLKILGGGVIEDILGIKLHEYDSNFLELEHKKHKKKNDDPADRSNNLEKGQIQLYGTKKKPLKIKNLEVRTKVYDLYLDNVSVDQKFTFKKITNLSIKKTVANDNWDFTKVDNIISFGLTSNSEEMKILPDKLAIISLSAPKGKFYIAPKSYIEFKKGFDGFLQGIDLFMDLSNIKSGDSSKKLVFPNKSFSFDNITIKGAKELLVPAGGICRNSFIIDECDKVNLYNLFVKKLEFTSKKSLSGGYHSKPLAFYLYDSKIANDLILIGNLTTSFRSSTAHKISTYGLVGINISGNSDIGMIEANLKLDAANKFGDIPKNRAVIRIENKDLEQTQIGNILAKLSTFYIKGNVKLGNVLIQPISNILTLFWVDIASNSRLSLNQLFVGFDHDITIGRDGTITVKQAERLLKGSDVNVSSYDTTSNKSIYIKAGMGIRFDGSLKVINGNIGFFAKCKDLFASGYLDSSNAVILSSEYGSVITQSLKLNTKSIAYYAHSDIYAEEVLFNAEKIVLYTLNGSLQLTKSDVVGASSIALLAKKGNIGIDSSNINSKDTISQSGGNTIILNSKIVSDAIYTQSVKDFISAKSRFKINLNKCPHMLFGTDNSNDNKLNDERGFKVAKDISLVAIFSEDKEKIYSNLNWQTIPFDKKATLVKGAMYIDSKNGYIIGSTIDSSDKVVVRIKDRLEIVPTIIYNNFLDTKSKGGGFNKEGAKEVVSRINAGLVDIDAKNELTSVGTIIKAIVGKISSDKVYILASPEQIKKQQERIKTLKEWFGPRHESKIIDQGKVNVGEYLQFSQLTDIKQRVGNLDVFDNFSSQDLAFTQKGGDMKINKSITKYGKLYLNAPDGKIIIVSDNLQNIYKGNGGGEYGKQKAMESRTIIGGDNVYIYADQLVSKGGRFLVKDNLKIVTKNGVHILPVSVHERLQYSIGDKRTVTEDIVLKVISEIKCGYLDIDAGGAFEAISALINATGVKLKAQELKLGAEREIFTKQIFFKGKKKLNGSRNESYNKHESGIVLPTIINAKNLYADITGDSTIAAAKILVENESIIKVGGNMKIMHKYDYHIHDHWNKESSLISFNKGMMKIGSTKTTRSSFYGEDPAPTIYYSGGKFFGYSEGKIHVLGSKIIGKDIYLLGQKGVKLEAAPMHQRGFVHVHETGFKMGFNSEGGKHSFSGNLYDNIDKEKYNQVLYDATEIHASGKLTIISHDGDLEIKSANLSFTKSDIKVRGLKMETHKNEYNSKSQSIKTSLGLHMGIQESLTPTINKLVSLVNKERGHWVDNLDSMLNAYSIYKSGSSIYNDASKLTNSFSELPSLDKLKDNLFDLASVKAGIWANFKLQMSEQKSSSKSSLDNQIKGGSLNLDVKEDAYIEGIKCDLKNLTGKIGGNFTVKAGSNTHKVTQQSGEFSMDIPIPGTGNTPFSVDISGNASKLTKKSFNYDNHITVSGKIDLDIKEDGKILGIKIQGKHVNIRAKNLVVESLQDTIEQRMSGFNAGFSLNEDLTKGIRGGGSGGSRDAKWTNAIAQIVGTEVVNIVLQQTLELTGALIANAEVDENGKLTDKGNCNIKAAVIQAKRLHDYDNGKMLGLGLSLSGIQSAKKPNVDLPVKYSFDESKRDLIPVLGKGIIKTEMKAQAAQEQYSRELREFIGKKTGKKASLDASIPVSDITEFLKIKFGSSKKSISGMSGGDQEINGSNDNEPPPEETEREKELRLAREKAATEKLNKEIIDTENQAADTLKKKYGEDWDSSSVPENMLMAYFGLSDQVRSSGVNESDVGDITNIAFNLYLTTPEGAKGETNQDKINASIKQATDFLEKGKISTPLSKLALGDKGYKKYQKLFKQKSEFQKGNYLSVGIGVVDPKDWFEGKSKLVEKPDLRKKEDLETYNALSKDIAKILKDAPKEKQIEVTNKIFNLAKESNNQSSDDKKKLSNLNEIKKVIGKIKETLQEEISNIDITDPLGKKFKQKPKTEKQITEGIWLAKIYNSMRGIDLGDENKQILVNDLSRDLISSLLNPGNKLSKLTKLLKETEGSENSSNKLKTLSKLEDGGKFKVKNKTSDTKTSNIDENKSLPKLKDKEIVGSGFTKDLNLYKKLAKKPGDVEKISSFIDSSPEFGKYLKNIPEGFKFTKYPKGNNTTGLVFKDGLHNEIAFKKAKLDSRHESHHVPYVTYKKHGNKHVAKNGDLIYNKGNIIVRSDHNGKNAVPIPKEELKRLNIDHPSKHPDVHIAIEDFVKLFNKKGK